LLDLETTVNRVRKGEEMTEKKDEIISFSARALILNETFVQNVWVWYDSTFLFDNML
jgi:hypothetical protein